MNDFETDGPALAEIAVALAVIFVIILLAFAWAC